MIWHVIFPVIIISPRPITARALPIEKALEDLVRERQTWRVVNFCIANAREPMEGICIATRLGVEIPVLTHVPEDDPPLIVNWCMKAYRRWVG